MWRGTFPAHLPVDCRADKTERLVEVAATIMMFGAETAGASVPILQAGCKRPGSGLNLRSNSRLIHSSPHRLIDTHLPDGCAQ
jgi:hypothetical protein